MFLLYFVLWVAFAGDITLEICIFGMWPCSAWLPKAGVAPTPVTALLHAVAVVKTGAFATMRVTYYTFGAEFLSGTWVQTLVMLLVIFTIVYGCSMGVKETYLKRRLAWSTVRTYLTSYLGWYLCPHLDSWGH